MIPTRSSGSRIGIRILVPLVLFSMMQLGYLVLTDHSGRLTLWDNLSRPLVVHISNSFDSAPNITEKSLPRRALLDALSTWARVSTLPLVGEPTTLGVAALDGTNLITIASDPAHHDLLGNGLAVSTVWTRPENGRERIIEADVILSPNSPTTWTTREKDVGENLFDIAIHEFGHAFGLKHPVARSSRMFFQGGAFGFNFSRLSWDDIAGVATGYPLPGWNHITGRLTGRVTLGGTPVFGAFVLATDSHGVLVASGITMPDGGYEIGFLPPGDYAIYTEPLDGPTQPRHIAGGIFDVGMIESDFLPAFHGGSPETLVRVNAGQTTSGVDIQVSGGLVDVDPEFLGVASDANSTLNASTRPAALPREGQTHLILAGTGVEDLRDGGVTIPGTHLDPGTVRLTIDNEQGVTFKLFPVSVEESTPEGPYSVFLETEQGNGVISGGLQVVPRFRFQQSFAQFAHIPGTATSKIFLINLDLEKAATGRLVARSSAGNLETVRYDNVPLDFLERAPVGIQPGGMIVAHTTGSREFVGSFRMEADQSVGGGLLIDTIDGTTGLEPSEPSYGFATPVEIADGIGVRTGVALTNLDKRPADVHLTLRDLQGQFRRSRTLTLAGEGHLAAFVGEADLIASPTGTAAFKGTLSVISNRLLSATAIRTSPGVFTTFPVILNRAYRKTVFSHFAVAPGFSSELILVNPSTVRAQQVVVQLRDADGRPAAVAFDGVPTAGGRTVRSIEPGGLAWIKGGKDPVSGWIEVSSDVPVGGVVLFQSTGFGTAGIGEGRPGRRFVLPLDRDDSTVTDTGVAIANTEGRSVTLMLKARGLAGETVGERQIELVANGHLARFPNDAGLSLGLPPQFSGSLWIESSGEISVSAIRQSAGVLTTLPVFPLDSAIDPR